MPFTLSGHREQLPFIIHSLNVARESRDTTGKEGEEEGRQQRDTLLADGPENRFRHLPIIGIE